MESLSNFFAMGGHAGYVWPSYALTAIVMLGLLLASLHSLRANEAELESLEAEAKELRDKRRAARRGGNEAEESAS
jgi:heme exporter protein D